MNTFDLRFVADALLAIVGQDSRAPFQYDTVRNYEPKLTSATIHEFVRVSTNCRPGDALWADECAEIFSQADLTRNQAEVLEMRLLGLSFEQIGKVRRSSRQAAMGVFLQALKKIGRVMRVYPYVGLSDVYRKEIRRGL